MTVKDITAPIIDNAGATANPTWAPLPNLSFSSVSPAKP